MIHNLAAVFDFKFLLAHRRRVALCGGVWQEQSAGDSAAIHHFQQQWAASESGRVSGEISWLFFNLSDVCRSQSRLGICINVSNVRTVERRGTCRINRRENAAVK